MRKSHCSHLGNCRNNNEFATFRVSNFRRRFSPRLIGELLAVGVAHREARLLLLDSQGRRGAASDFNRKLVYPKLVF